MGKQKQPPAKALELIAARTVSGEPVKHNANIDFDTSWRTVDEEIAGLVEVAACLAWAAEHKVRERDGNALKQSV